MRYQWEKLNKQQLGSYAEYFIKMELTMYGFQVYSPEVDDRGIDFICRYEDGHFIQIQVKSVFKANYVYMEKSKFEPSNLLWLTLVYFENGEKPKLFLIPSIVWNNPEQPFVSREEYKRPEFGINISRKNLPKLEKYKFDNMIDEFIKKGKYN